MKYLGGLAIAACLCPFPAASAQDPATDARPAGAVETPATAREEAPVKKRRLKFKSDKACTCTSALGEADIEIAAEKAAMEKQSRRDGK